MVDPGSPKRDGYKWNHLVYVYIYIFSSCKLKVFRKNCSWVNGLTIFHKNPKNIYIYIYMYWDHWHATSQVLRVSDLKSLANWNCSSSLINLPMQKTNPFWDHCHLQLKRSQILPSKHPNTWGCQNLTKKVLGCLGFRMTHLSIFSSVQGTTKPLCKPLLGR